MSGRKENTKSPRKTPSVQKNSKKTGPSKKATRAARPEDNRDSQRIPIQLLVDYRCDGHYLFDFCRDLGTGGVFIQTSEPLPQGSNVDLTFTIPDSKETLETTGKVIWVQEKVKNRNDLTPGMGVQFARFDGSQRKILEEFVTRYHSTKSFPIHSSPKQSA